MLWDLWPTFTSDPRLLSGWPSTSRQESDPLKSGTRVVVTVVSLLILVPAVVMASAVEVGNQFGSVGICHIDHWVFALNPNPNTER